MRLLILCLLYRCASPPPFQEAAWAISNATSGGKPEQIKYLVTEGCIPPLSDLLEVHDAKIVTVALEGLENILKVSVLLRFSKRRPVVQSNQTISIEETGLVNVCVLLGSSVLSKLSVKFRNCLQC